MMENGSRRRRPNAKQRNKGALLALLLLLFRGGSVRSQLVTTTRASSTRAISESTEMTKLGESSQEPPRKNEFSASVAYPDLGTGRLNSLNLSESLDRRRTSEAEAAAEAAAAAAAAAAFVGKKTKDVSALENTIGPPREAEEKLVTFSSSFNGINGFTPSGYFERSDTTSGSDNSTTTKRRPPPSPPPSSLLSTLVATFRQAETNATEAPPMDRETSGSTLPRDPSSALPRAAASISPIDDTTYLRVESTQTTELSPSSSSPSLSSDSYSVDYIGWSSERNAISPLYEQNSPKLPVSSFNYTLSSTADSNNTESSRDRFSIPPVQASAATTTTTTTTTEVSVLGASAITDSPMETANGDAAAAAAAAATAATAATAAETATTTGSSIMETTTMTTSSDVPDVTFFTDVTTMVINDNDVTTLVEDSSSTWLPDTVTASSGVISSTMEIASDTTTILMVTENTSEDEMTESTSETRTDYASTEQTTVMRTESMDYSTKERKTSWQGTTTPTTTTTTTTTTPGSPPVYRSTVFDHSELTALVKITFEGTWAEVCPHLPALRQSLGDLLTLSLKKNISAARIMFDENPCADDRPSITLESSVTGTSLLLYVVDKDGNLDVETTKLVPRFVHEARSASGQRITIRSFQLVQRNAATTTTTAATAAAAAADSSNAVAVIVVSCVALVCLALLAVLLFVVTSRRTRFNYGERCRPVSLDAYSLDNVSAYSSVRTGRKAAASVAVAATVAAAATALRASKRSYGNPGFEDSTATPSHPLNFAGLSGFCKDRDKMREEFAGIPQVMAGIDELPAGAEVKNRYANVIALPETRVPLARINDDPLSEYINASYVRGPKNATKYYIACQAPLESTVADFWRMIWEQRSKVVIMLTDLAENGVEKCAEYVPPSEITDCRRLFGDFQITLKKRESKEKYAISSIRLKNLDKDSFREISHIWYPWPTADAATQRTDTGAALIAVLLEARALQRGGPAPVVVHCSPGTGRTGTLIALDLAIRQYEITRTVDVPRVVYTIRRDRAGAVRTNEQYALVYEALNLYASRLAGGASEA